MLLLRRILWRTGAGLVFAAITLPTLIIVWLSFFDQQLMSFPPQGYKWLTIFPLVVSNVVRSAGWTAILGNSGLINGALRAPGLITEPLKLMYTEGAVIAGIVTLVLPHMILTIASVVEGTPPSLEGSATNLGARPGTAFRCVIGPCPAWWPAPLWCSCCA